MLKYCSGKHKCVLCGDVFDCTGEASMHDPGEFQKGSGRCNGGYEQFCDNHTVDEYNDYFYKIGELG